MRAAAAILVVWCGLSVGSVAFGQTANEWQQTFGREAFAPYVQAGSTRVIVVAAGQEAAEASAAATAIEGRLREASAALVMGDDALGAVADLDDPTIVTRAAAMPVDRVLIVRVFLGAAGEPPSAVAILYAKDGSVVTALNGTRGRAMNTPAAAATTTAQPAVPASAGVDSRAADAVSAITRNQRSSSDDAQRQYDEQFVGFTEMAAVNQHGSVLATWSAPYRGKYRTPLNGAEFYSAVGREDLADRFRSKHAVKLGLSVGGLAAVIAGGAIMLWGVFDSESDTCETYSYSNPDECLIYEDDYTLMWVGMGVMGVGGALTLAAMFINPHPVDPAEARRIADEHNQRLRERLGLSSESAALHIPTPPRARLSWNGFATPQAAGLTLRLQM